MLQPANTGSACQEHAGGDRAILSTTWAASLNPRLPSTHRAMCALSSAATQRVQWQQGLPPHCPCNTTAASCRRTLLDDHSRFTRWRCGPVSINEHLKHASKTAIPRNACVCGVTACLRRMLMVSTAPQTGVATAPHPFTPLTVWLMLTGHQRRTTAKSRTMPRVHYRHSASSERFLPLAQERVASRPHLQHDLPPAANVPSTPGVTSTTWSAHTMPSTSTPRSADAHASGKTFPT